MYICFLISFNIFVLKFGNHKMVYCQTILFQANLFHQPPTDLDIMFWLENNGFEAKKEICQTEA